MQKETKKNSSIALRNHLFWDFDGFETFRDVDNENHIFAKSVSLKISKKIITFTFETFD